MQACEGVAWAWTRGRRKVWITDDVNLSEWHGPLDDHFPQQTGGFPLSGLFQGVHFDVKPPGLFGPLVLLSVAQALPPILVS